MIITFRKIRHYLTAVLCTTVAFGGALTFHSAKAAEGSASPPCPMSVAPEPRDYRLRNTDQGSPPYRWAYEDNWRAHSVGAIRGVRAGQFTKAVRYNLDWTLFRWPNHLPVLEALIEYDVRNGPTYGYPMPECYFYRARMFAPDDINVLLAEGVYFWRKGNLPRAIQSYESALTLDPTSADAHYNAGLAYAEAGDYEKALGHAWAAYGQGYPLPGLRRKLSASGHWKDPPAADRSRPN